MYGEYNASNVNPLPYQYNISAGSIEKYNNFEVIFL
jgi:hypothetical protein